MIKTQQVGLEKLSDPFCGAHRNSMWGRVGAVPIADGPSSDFDRMTLTIELSNAK